MLILADTNILLAFGEKGHRHHSAARAALKNLWGDNHNVCVTLQNFIEFWSVATRPANKNGLGLSIKDARRLLRMFDRLFTLVPENPEIQKEWRRLVFEHQVLGVQVHDARLVAAMRVHNISHILTFNIKDFARYRREGIVVIDPSKVLL